MTTPPAGPRPLLLSLRIWNERFCVRKGTIGSTERPPKALSERLSSMREVLDLSASQIEERACGISEMRRPVKMSAKSAT